MLPQEAQAVADEGVLVELRLGHDLVPPAAQCDHDAPERHAEAADGHPRVQPQPLQALLDRKQSETKQTNNHDLKKKKNLSAP